MYPTTPRLEHSGSGPSTLPRRNFDSSRYLPSCPADLALVVRVCGFLGRPSQTRGPHDASDHGSRGPSPRSDSARRSHWQFGPGLLKTWRAACRPCPGSSKWCGRVADPPVSGSRRRRSRVMVVPAREPAYLGTSHEPARPYNSVRGSPNPADNFPMK